MDKTPQPEGEITPKKVDFNYIFNIEENEFDEMKRVTQKYSMLCFNGESKALGYLDVVCVSSNEGDTIAIMYDERYLIDYLKEIERFDEMERAEIPSKGIVINVDGNEHIKIPANSSEDGLSLFDLDNELFLKCCNAKQLQFKLFKEDGSSMILKGENEEEEKNLLTSFRAMYNYFVDQSAFTNAPAVLQQILKVKDEEREAQEKIEEKKQQQAVQSENGKQNKNIYIGIGLVIVGIIMFLVGVSDFNDKFILIIISILPIVIGAVVVMYGNYRKKGYSETEAWNKIAEVFSKMKH